MSVRHVHRAGNVGARLIALQLITTQPEIGGKLIPSSYL